MIDRVTITGADDTVKPEELLALSQEFPFVEWGILFGSEPGPRPRFPSDDWIIRLATLAATEKLQLSAHLCGRWVRDWVVAASPTWRLSYGGGFQRIQFNFHGQFHRAGNGFLDLLKEGNEYIFQVDGVNDHATAWIRREGLTTAFPLFDTSGGAGVVPDAWPAPMPDVYCGYAGGLGPENLAEQIPLILAAAGEARIWIDMETKVRSEDDRHFDLSKVRKCLEIASDYVSAKKGS